MKRLTWIVPTVYILLLLLPIYWLVNMSFKTTNKNPRFLHPLAESVYL